MACLTLAHACIRPAQEIRGAASLSAEKQTVPTVTMIEDAVWLLEMKMPCSTLAHALEARQVCNVQLVCTAAFWNASTLSYSGGGGDDSNFLSATL